MSAQPHQDVQGEPVYPNIRPDTRVWVWPGARPDGRRLFATTISGCVQFGGHTPCYRVRFDNGASDYILWTHVQPVDPVAAKKARDGVAG